MEGKELYNNDDEELDPKKKKEEENAEDFGLPEIEDSEDDSSDLAEPSAEIWEEDKVEDSNTYSDSSDDDSSTEDTTDAVYDFEDDTTEATADDGYQSSYYEEENEKKKSPVGWIILGVILLIAIIIGVFIWLNKDSSPDPVVTRKPAPVVVQPTQEPDPVIVEEEPTPEPEVINNQAGVFDLNSPNGRYHVIVASSIDADLVRDYANKLADQGMTCNILAPLGNKKFHRLSVADYASLNDAAIKSEQLKNEIGPDVWVIRY